MRPSPLVIFHICVGTIGILSGAAALFFVKVPIGLRRSRLRAHDRRHPAHDAAGCEPECANLASLNIVVR